MTAFALAPFDAAAGYNTAAALGDTTVPDTAWAGSSGDLKVRADPADGTVGADRDSLGTRGIVVSFSQPVDSLAYTVRLVNEILRPVSWVTFWPRPDTAVLRPTRTRDRLLAGTTYYIRVWQGDPESGRSRLIAQFGFTTRVEPSSGAADTSRVFLLWSFPQDGTLNADADRVVNQGCALYFSGLIDASEVRATLRGLSIGRAASLQVTPTDSTMYLGLAPDDQPLLAKPGHYRIVITGLRDAIGAPVSVPEITFVTQTGGVPANGAHLLEVRPTGLEEGVDVTELNQYGVYLYFSSPIDASQASCRLTSDGEYLVWLVEAVEDSVLVLHGGIASQSPLSGDRTYALVVTGLVDRGERAASEVHLTIRTRHSADSTGTVPPDSSATPSDTAAVEPVDDTADSTPPGITAATISPCVPPEGYGVSRLPRLYRVDFAFTEALDPVNVPTVTTWAASGRASIRYAEWSAAAVTLVVEVWEVQREGTECRIQVTGARDPRGNIAPELVLTFFVPGMDMPDETPPELLLSQPSSGTLVEPRSLIRDGVRLVFSGPVDTTQVQVQVLLDGQPVAWRRVWGSGGMQLTLRPPPGTTPAEGQGYEVHLANLRAPTGGQATSTVVAFSTTPSAGVELISIDCDTTAGNQHLRLSQAHGNLVTVELLANRVPRITGWSATVNFDPVQLRYRRDSFQPGTLVSELTPLVDAREGCVSVGGAVLGGGPGGWGSGRLGHLSFEVVDGFSGDAWLEVVDVRLALPAGDVYRSTVASRATISCPSATASVPILTLDLDPASGDQGVHAVVGATAGQRYPVELHLQLAPAATGWSAALRYDPRDLRYVPGSFCAGDYLAGLVPLVDDRPGMVTIGGSLLGTAASDSGSGWLGTVTFAVQQALVDQTEIVATELALRTVEHVTARSDPAASVTIAGVPMAAISLDSDLAEGDQQQLLVRRLDPGGRVTLQVHVHHARGVDGWSATLTYEPGAFRYLPNGFISTDFIPGFVSLIDEDEGRVSIGGGVLGPAPGADGDGLLGVISLAGLEGARNGATIRLTEYTLHLANGNLIRVQPSDVSVILDLLIDGVTAVSADDSPVSLPAVSALGLGYPNPFNGRTVLPVLLAAGDVGWVDVYDAQGQRVRCLAEGLRGPGSFLLPWDGTDDLGRPLAAGIYLVRMQAGTHRQVRRMALIK